MCPFGRIPLSPLTQRFELTFLTGTQNFPSRKLRSYCASLGGTGQILCNFDDFKRQTVHQEGKSIPQIVLYDTQLKLTTHQLESLKKFDKLIVIDQPTAATPILTQNLLFWEGVHFCCTSIDSFFDSSVVRVALSDGILNNKPFHLSHLMRWGHSSQVWLPQAGQSMSDLSLGFSRSLKLNGESRRLIEMANHFMVTFPSKFEIRLNSLTFASDGIITGIIAHLSAPPPSLPQDLIDEITMMEFPVCVINRTSEISYEWGALVFHNQSHPTAEQRMFLNLSLNLKALHQKQVQTTLPTLTKAG